MTTCDPEFVVEANVYGIYEQGVMLCASLSDTPLLPVLQKGQIVGAPRVVTHKSRVWFAVTVKYHSCKLSPISVQTPQYDASAAELVTV